jgi:uncharacterized membrane protein YkoI
MINTTTIRKSAVTVAALGAFGLGGAALAGAADDAKQNRPAREALSGDVAAKVEAAALEKVPGATVLRAEAGGPYGTAYHAHIRTADGTRQVVLVNRSFEATAVQEDRGRGRRGRGETALTGATKQKVEAAVLARYPNATIVRTETNRDSSAPYESHITTSDGKEFEVLVSAGFEVVDAREHPARP